MNKFFLENHNLSVEPMDPKGTGLYSQYVSLAWSVGPDHPQNRRVNVNGSVHPV